MATNEGLEINRFQLMHLDKQAKKHLLLLEDEEKRLLNELPLSSFGPMRVPRHLTADIVLGQIKKRKIDRTKG